MCFYSKKLGSRTLRFKDQGVDVQMLHEFLRLQGYDLGEEDHYGYLTKDAVRQFQREHGLVADGIAGPRCFALIRAHALPKRRQIHIVAPGETLEQIGEIHGVQPQAFAAQLGSGGIYPGRRLLFYHREIWAIAQQEQVEQFQQTNLTGLISAPETVPPQGVACLAKADLGDQGDLRKIHELLNKSKRRKRAAAALVNIPKEFRGLYLGFPALSRADCGPYLKLLKMLRKKLPVHSLLCLEFGPGLPPWKVWGGFDYYAANKLADRLILTFPPPTEPGPPIVQEQLEAALDLFAPLIYPWKILIKLPVYALQWELSANGNSWQQFSYERALARAFRHGARLDETDEGRPFYHYQSRGKRYQLIIPQYQVLEGVLGLVNRYHLAGIVLDRLGLEDPRLWAMFGAHFRAAEL